MASFRRVAVLSDIHGNLPALDAVLADVQAAEPDLIVLNGDLIDGPFPEKTFQRLVGLGSATLWLRGNGDRWLAEASAGKFRHPDAATHEMIRWSSQNLTSAQLNFLRSLPLSRTIDVVGVGQVAFCHATARSDNEMLLVDSPIEHYEAALASIDAATVIMGHTHMPFDRLANRRRVVNSGSVGMPYGHAGASWLMIDGAVVLRRTLYDTQSAAAMIARSGMPDADAFARDQIVMRPSDAEALTAFSAARDKQQALGSFD